MLANNIMVDSLHNQEVKCKLLYTWLFYWAFAQTVFNMIDNDKIL